MEPDEILDPNSLERWLESRNQSDGIIIATRAAQRVLPLWSPDLRQDLRRILEVTALQILRELLTSGVAAVSPSPEIKAASIAAFTVANATAYAAPSTPGTYAAAAADAAAATAAAQPGAAYSSTVAKAAAAAYSAAAFDDASSFWKQIQVDASAIENGLGPLHTPLWSDLAPDWFTQTDGIDRAIWQTQDPAHWSFWQRWWDGVISGRQIEWALQEKIALIPDEDWKAGPKKDGLTPEARIAKRIEVIEEIFRLQEEVAALKREFSWVALRPATPEHRAHNNPPEVLSAEVEAHREIVILLRTLDDADEELAKPDPSPPLLRRFGLALIEIARRIASYCVTLGDIAARKAADQIGETAVKWGVRYLVATMASQTEPVRTVGQELVKLANQILGGG